MVQRIVVNNTLMKEIRKVDSGLEEISSDVLWQSASMLCRTPMSFIGIIFWK